MENPTEPAGGAHPARPQAKILSNLQARRKVFPLLLLDAVIYGALAHQAADAALLAHDGFYSKIAAGGILLGILAALCALEFFYWKMNARHFFTTHVPHIAFSVGIIIFIALFIWLPLAKVNAPVAKGMTYMFLPLEWHKFPRNYILMWRTAPIYCAVFAAILAGAVYFRFVSKRRLLTVAFLFAAFILLSIKSLAVVNFDRDKNLSFFFYPLLLMSITAMFGYPRLFARTVVAGGAFTLVGLFYIGLMPLKFAFGPAVTAAPYIEQVFTPSRQTTDIDPMFFREMTADPDGRFLYISYGPTSGIAKIDVQKKSVDTLLHIPGMMRFLWDSGGPGGTILGLDWLHADMKFFNKTPFSLARTVDLLATDPTPSPFDFDVDVAHNRLFIVNYELSGITTYSYPEMKKLARSDFRKQGITRLNSGGQKIIYDARANKIYALTGWIDWLQSYYILVINPDTLAIENKLSLPTAGLELYLCEHTGTLFSVDFYGRTIYEIEAPALKVKRTIEGPLGCRNIVCDPVRNAIYATGYADGMLQAIDYPTGRTTAKFCVGPKPSSMAIVPGRGELFVGSGAGILKIKLDQLPK